VRSGSTTSEITTLYLAGCRRGASPIRKQLGIGLKGDGNCSSCARRSIAAMISTTASDRKGRHYHVAGRPAHLPHPQDSTENTSPACVVAQDSDMVAQFATTIGDAAAVRDDQLQRVGQTCCWPIATATARGCSSPAMPCIS